MQLWGDSQNREDGEGRVPASVEQVIHGVKRSGIGFQRTMDEIWKLGDASRKMFSSIDICAIAAGLLTAFSSVHRQSVISTEQELKMPSELYS
jgi:hypothetical protein